MRLILPSGCPPLEIVNGGVNCNPTKQKCEIICRFGYQLSPEGTGLKICNGLTGIWQTQPIPTCKRSLKKRGVSRFGRRSGRDRSNLIDREISEFMSSKGKSISKSSLNKLSTEQTPSNCADPLIA